MNLTLALLVVCVAAFAPKDIYDDANLQVLKLLQVKMAEQMQPMSKEIVLQTVSDMAERDARAKFAFFEHSNLAQLRLYAFMSLHRAYAYMCEKTIRDTPIESIPSVDSITRAFKEKHEKLELISLEKHHVVAISYYNIAYASIIEQTLQNHNIPSADDFAALDAYGEYIKCYEGLILDCVVNLYFSIQGIVFQRAREWISELAFLIGQQLFIENQDTLFFLSNRLRMMVFGIANSIPLRHVRPSPGRPTPDFPALFEDKLHDDFYADVRQDHRFWAGLLVKSIDDHIMTLFHNMGKPPQPINPINPLPAAIDFAFFLSDQYRPFGTIKIFSMILNKFSQSAPVEYLLENAKEVAVNIVESHLERFGDDPGKLACFGHISFRLACLFLKRKTIDNVFDDGFPSVETLFKESATALQARNVKASVKWDSDFYLALLHYHVEYFKALINFIPTPTIADRPSNECLADFDVEYFSASYPEKSPSIESFSKEQLVIEPAGLDVPSDLKIAAFNEIRHMYDEDLLPFAYNLCDCMHGQLVAKKWDHVSYEAGIFFRRVSHTQDPEYKLMLQRIHACLENVNPRDIVETESLSLPLLEEARNKLFANYFANRQVIDFKVDHRYFISAFLLTAAKYCFK